MKTQVEVQIELGHSASPRDKPTSEGYTHTWTVYVRGVNGSNIRNYVEKVIFLLHDDFPRPRRVLKEPPFEITENGYAGFELPIEIYFRNKEDPKKVVFTYDLFLKLTEPCETSRAEKLTFLNPNDEFKKKLLKSGGVIHDKSQNSDSPSRSLSSLAFGDDSKHSHKSTKSLSRDGTIGDKKKSSKMASVIPSKDKSLHSQQSSSLSSSQGLSTTLSSHHSQQQTSSFHEKSSVNSNLPQPSSQSLQDPFTDLFGTPIKTRPSPDSLNFKHKDNGGIGSGTSKLSSSSHKSSTKKISSSDKSSSDLITKSSEKEKKHKSINGTIISSKEIKTEKDAKTIKDKSLKKRDESPKIKKEKISKSSFDGRPTTPNLSATSSSKKSSSLNNTTSIKKETIDNLGVGGSGSSSKESTKKRKRSLSPPSFPTPSENIENKDTESLIKSSSKDGLSDKSHKEKSKKQKLSSRDQVSSSATTGSNSNHKVKDVKKELSTSTTISLTNNENTGTTTLEIKSVKKEKTWDSEMKKSRSKEHKSDEVKSSRENLSKDVNKVQVRDKEMIKEKEKETQPVPEKKDKEKSKDKSSKNRDKDRDREKEKEKSRKDKEKEAIHDDLFSPKDSVVTKFKKLPREKYHGANLNINNHLSAHVNSLRETSSSPASIVSGSLTPGGGAFIGAPSSVSSLNGPITTLMAEMDQESLPVSPLSSSCDPSSPLAFGSKDKEISSEDDNSNPAVDHRSNSNNHSKDISGNKNSINFSNSHNINTNKSSSSIHGNNKRKDNIVRDEPPPASKNIHSADRSKSTREMPSSNNNNNNSGGLNLNKKRKENDSLHHAKQVDLMDDAMDIQISPRQQQADSRTPASSYDCDYISQLKILHRKINDLRDRDVLQRIVDIIEETGLFNMTSAAFDFDLMQLDRNTIRKIRQCLIST